MTTKSFQPHARILMGPGPSDVHPRILSAMARPTIGHLDPQFIAMMEEVKVLLQYVFQTKNTLTIPVSAPGSAGMETCFVNLISPGDTVIVCQNGVFGGRMQENVERCGAKAIMLQDEWGKAIDLNKVEETLKTYPEAKILAFVHAETSTGVVSDAQALAQLAQQYNCLTIMDAVTSLAGIPVYTDDWGIDAIYSGSQKCLSCVPGLSPVSFSERAIEHIRNRSTKVQSWFLDLNLVMGYWGGNTKRAYHHTAPINALYALHEALVILQEEGLEKVWHRHQHYHNALKAGLEAMGIEFLVEESARLPQLNAILIPEGTDDIQIRKNLLQTYNLEIGAGLGNLAGKIWRIGLMGYSAHANNVLYVLAALESVLSETNASIKTGVAIQAAQQIISEIQ